MNELQSICIAIIPTFVDYCLDTDTDEKQFQPKSKRKDSYLELLYKNLNHRPNYCKLSLTGDIEILHDPMHFYCCKKIFMLLTFKVMLMFNVLARENACQQCVGISLRSYIRTCVPPWLNTLFKCFS